MREAGIPVTFEPSGKTVYVLQGTGLLEAAAGADIVLDQPCGGAGVCGKCRLLVSKGACQPTAAETERLSEEELRSGWRLACQSSVTGPATVEVPESSLLAAAPKILARSEAAGRPAGDPPVDKRYVELPVPRRGDDDADLVRLQKALGPFWIGLETLRNVPGRLRESDFRGTAVLADDRLIEFEPGNTESENFAVAFDVGTTTLAGALLEVNTAEEIAVALRMNPQTRFGDDVLSRILYARDDPHGLELLHETVVGALDEMIGELAEKGGIGRERIYELTLSGNTTMQQLLCRLDCESLATVPFVPVAGRSLLLSAAELGLRVHPRAAAWVLPVIGGFVGGDTVAGILATGMADADRPTLMVDIGTNGEIVLAAEGKLAAASTAAGPAFEGARIMHGMRGTSGAIEKVVVDGRLRTNVIGDVPPVGLCGSALIDVAAELLRHGLLAADGRLRKPGDLPQGVLPDLARRLVSYEGQVGFMLAAETETGNGKPVVLTQGDVRELQLAAGAIRAGITVLLKRAGLKPEDLQGVLIGGGFGNFIRRSNAQRIGLLPCRVERERIRYRGNISLAGARLGALSRQARRTADHIARRTEHVDLSIDPEFQAAFAAAMVFPESR